MFIHSIHWNYSNIQLLIYFLTREHLVIKNTSSSNVRNAVRVKPPLLLHTLVGYQDSPWAIRNPEISEFLRRCARYRNLRWKRSRRPTRDTGVPIDKVSVVHGNHKSTVVAEGLLQPWSVRAIKATFSIKYFIRFADRFEIRRAPLSGFSRISAPLLARCSPGAKKIRWRPAFFGAPNS